MFSHGKVATNMSIGKQGIAALMLLAGVSGASALEKAKRPNFVWLISEDNSVHYMDLYDKTGAKTPQIEKLAGQGVVFNHAFSVAPVCSAARSVLATGCYGSRIGTQFHRLLKRVPLPESVQPVFSVMRDAGYYTSNQTKKDYNFRMPASKWHSSGDWRGRSEGQPFFHKQNFGITHESSLHNEENYVESTEGFVSPRHPDTPLFRQTHSTYTKLMTDLDTQVGVVIDELKKDGLLEDTFIFYFGDHGGVLPGSKGYVYETGLHVPLVVRIPKNFAHLVDLEPGTRTDGFVEFVDFGATIMHLAGITPPGGIDGKPFMGPGISKEDLERRDEAFGHADRFDEKYDLVRSLRKGSLKYIRSFQPFNIDGLYNNYRYKMPAYQEWRELYKAGKLNKVQAQFFEPRTPEALYDVVKDPYETKNLATDPAYATQLKVLRERLNERIKAMPDLSLYPESHLIPNAFTPPENPVVFGQKHKEEIGQLLDVANLALLPFAEAKPKIAEALASDNPWVRYWGFIVCSCFMQEAGDFVETAKECAASDKNLLVRTRAAEFLGLIGAQNPGPVLIDVLAKSESFSETLLILNSAALMKELKPGYDITIDPEVIRFKGGFVSNRIEYLTGFVPEKKPKKK